MPAVGSGRRDWPGPEDCRQAEVPFKMRAGVRPPVARSCLARRAPNGGMGVVRLPAVVRRAGGTGHWGRYLRCCVGEGRCGQGSKFPVKPVLDGTVALVTGASGGIGAASASALAAQGAAVALAARRDRLERSPPASGTRAALRWCRSAVSPASSPRPAAPQSPRRLALGRRHGERLEPDHRTASTPPNDQPETSHRSGIRRTRGPGGAPATRPPAGFSRTRTLKSRSTT